MTDHCCYCELSSKEMRPYGPKGAMLCFDCMMATPEREATAKRQFGAQLDACGDVAIVDGSNVGPYPPPRKRQ